MRFCVCLPVVLAVSSVGQAVFYGQPEQIHISYAGDPTRMWVTWVVRDLDTSYIEYGQQNFNRLIKTYTMGNGALLKRRRLQSNATLFVDGGSLHRQMYMHRALLTGLQPVYHVGGDLGWSAVYYFKALQPGADGNRFAVYGDMGNKNSQSLGRITGETQRGHFDMILHIGDLAYDMDTANATYGDQFMRQIEPAAAYVPYMVVPGNHENAYNFSNYVNRFTMPNWQQHSNHFWSFDLGSAHFVGFSTEFWYYTKYGTDQIDNQYDWIVNDLKAANANRARVPWIITMGHRPMYCGNWNDNDCTKYNSRIRTGFTDSDGKHYKGLEDLFYQQGVDLELWGHEHSFERMWPVYNRTVYNGTATPYEDPPAPVHIVTGSAGCQEDTGKFNPDLPPWSAFHSSDYGYSRMQIYNGTHLHFEQVSDDQNGKVIDEIWLVKQKHGAYDQLRQDAKMEQKVAKGVHVPESYQMPGDNRPRLHGHLL